MAIPKTKNKTPVVPNRGLEITAITKCDRPKPWHAFDTPAGDADELAAMAAKEWFPTTDYFRLVGNTPNTQQKGMTELVNVAILADLLNAIIGKPKKRDPQSIAQLNIIGHASKKGSFALSSTYVLKGDKDPHDQSTMTDGDIIFDGSIQGTTDDLASLQTTTLDDFVMGWLGEDVDPNHPQDPNEVERVRLRNAARAAFRPDALIVFLMCHTAGGLSANLRRIISKTLNVATAGWVGTIVYHPDPNATAVAAKRIKKKDLLTSENEKGTAGMGYPCFVSVDASLRGDHLRKTMGVTLAPAAGATVSVEQFVRDLKSGNLRNRL